MENLDLAHRTQEKQRHGALTFTRQKVLAELCLLHFSEKTACAHPVRLSYIFGRVFASVKKFGGCIEQEEMPGPRSAFCRTAPNEESVLAGKA